MFNTYNSNILVVVLVVLVNYQITWRPWCKRKATWSVRDGWWVYYRSWSRIWEADYSLQCSWLPTVSGSFTFSKDFYFFPNCTNSSVHENSCAAINLLPTACHIIDDMVVFHCIIKSECCISRPETKFNPMITSLASICCSCVIPWVDYHCQL